MLGKANEGGRRMKKIILVLVMGLIFGSNLFANPLQFMWKQNDEWSLQDSVLQIAVISSISIDMMQTNYALKHGCKEENPILS